MNKHIKKAIEQNKGKHLVIGEVFAHESDPMTYYLVDIVGDVAILEYNGVVKKFPKSEVFDANIVCGDAVKLSFEEKCKKIKEK